MKVPNRYLIVKVPNRYLIVKVPNRYLIVKVPNSFSRVLDTYKTFYSECRFVLLIFRYHSVSIDIAYFL